MSDTKVLVPEAIDDKLQMAKMLAQSGLMPDGLRTPAQVFVALQMGAELGLSPMIAVNNIAVIKGRPTLSAAIMDAIARNHPAYRGMTITYNDSPLACTVIIRRAIGDNIEEFTGYFDWDEAAAAGLVGKDNWRNYPKRMLKARAMSFAARDAFPDALAGMYSKEEYMDEPDLVEPRDVSPEKAPEEIKKDGAEVDIPIEQLEPMLSENEIKEIDEKLSAVNIYIDTNREFITDEAVAFTKDKARDMCIRRFYREGTAPTKYLDELHDKLREQVKTGEADKKDKEAVKNVPARSKPIETGGNELNLMKEVEGKIEKGKVSDAVVEPMEPDDHADTLFPDEPPEGEPDIW